MNKQETLTLLREKLEDKTVSRDEVRKVLHDHAEGESTRDTSRHLTNVLYIIGGIIAVVGAIILVVQNWSEIGFAGRVLVTLGVAVVTYAYGLFFKKDEERILSEVFFTMSAVLAPIGVLVTLSEFDIKISSIILFAVFFSLLLVYVSAYIVTRRNILTLFAALFATVAYFSILSEIFILTADIVRTATMVWGISLLCLAMYYQYGIRLANPEEKKEKSIVENILYGVGTIFLIAPALFFGGIFDLLAILFVFGGFYLSVFVRSKTMLAVSAAFLVAHVFKLTAKYFADSVGWPLALIALGFVVIGIGYGTLYVGRKYIVRAGDSQ